MSIGAAGRTIILTEARGRGETNAPTVSYTISCSTEGSSQEAIACRTIRSRSLTTVPIETYTLPLFKGCIRTMDLRQIKVSDDDFGVMGYDPAFMNTASCQSSVTFIDGDRGILRYRGYPIEQLAEKCTFLEVAYLILNGELPTAKPARRLGRGSDRTHAWSTRTSRRSWTASTTTRIPWAC